MSSKRTSGLGSLRKRISARRKDKGSDTSSVISAATEGEEPVSNGHNKRETRSAEPLQANANRRGPANSARAPPAAETKSNARRSANTETASATADDEQSVGSQQPRGRGGVFQRLRERSRSRSRTRALSARQLSAKESSKEMLVAVTSCRSDGYYNQKAPGSISKLPRKAPTNLKLFHELAVGVKDAYAAVGATPRNPSEEEKRKLEQEELDAKHILWDFVGNLDFVSCVCVCRSCQRHICLCARPFWNETDDTIFSVLFLATGFGGRSFSRYCNPWSVKR